MMFKIFEKKRIPFNIYKLSIIEKIKFVIQFSLMRQISGDGEYCRINEKILELHYYPSSVLLTNSCSGALDICAKLLPKNSKMEIIVPAFTFVTSVSHFAEKGFILKFCDINYVDLCLDIDNVKKLINQNTLAIVVTNYAGINTKIKELSELAKRNNIFLIEDNAQGIFSKSEGKYLGTFGDLSVLSFHETKSISSGEGGAIVINNPIFHDRAIKLRDKGTNRREFDNNLVKKYDWYENGSNYYMSEIHALFLHYQLKSYIKKISKRKKIWFTYYNAISKLEFSDKFSLPDPALFKNSNYHIFYMIFKRESDQKRFIKIMDTLNISTPFHYTDLSQSPGGKIFQSAELPVTKSITQSIVRLPLFTNLSSHNLRRILKGIKKFLTE